MADKVIGLGPASGFLGVNPDWVNLSIPNERTVFSTYSDGTPQVWSTSDNQEVGGQLLADGNYANPVDIARQERNDVVGNFTDGFTYTNPNQVGKYDDGLGDVTYWAYGDAIPAGGFVVAAGTVPSEPDYEQVTFNSSSQIFNNDGTTAQDTYDATIYLAGRVEEIPDEVDVAGTAQALVNSHNSDESAHPELSAFITSEADRAETSANSAALAANVYADTTEGLTETVVGEQFQVLSDDSLEYIRYRHGAGDLATEVGRYPSSDYVKSSQETLYSKGLAGDIIAGSLVSAVTGGQSTNASYNRTDYIPIGPEQAFRFEGKALLQSGIAFYDESKVFISGIEAPSSGLYSSPLNASYLRACTSTDENPNLNIYIPTVGSNNFTVNGESQEMQLNTLSNSAINLVENTDTSNGAIKADGTIEVTTAYTVTDFIPLVKGSYVEYTGRVISPYLAVSLYDKNKKFIGAATNVSGDVTASSVNTGDAVYIRSCSSNLSVSDFSVKTLSYNMNKDFTELSNSVDSLYLAEIDLIPSQQLTNQYINADGSLSNSTNYRCTPLIKLASKASFKYAGRVISPVIGFAIYDSSGDFIESAVVENGNVVDYDVLVDNEDAAYIRACSSTASPSPFSLTTLSYNVSSEDKPEIKIIPYSSSAFRVAQLTDTGEYITHLFQRRNIEEYTEDGWYSSWVEHNGKDVAQGNFNFIHNIDNTNENKFVGIGHGCEVFNWVRFFVDGEQFDPTTNTKEITGSRFHFQFLSDIYKADESAGGGEFTIAATPLEISTIHYMDCEITKEGVKRYNKLIVQRNNTVFRQLFGAMQQTNQDPMNGDLLYNADIPFRVYFPTSNDVPEPLSPDTTVIGGDVPLPNINKVTATGEDSGYAYTVETKIWNADNAKSGDIAIRSWTSRTGSNKIYFCPEVTTYTDGVLGKTATEFNSGDVIECYSYTKYGVSKL